MKERESRPHPFFNFCWGLISPIVAWWGFFGAVPGLVYGLFGLAAVIVAALVMVVLLQFVRLIVSMFSRSAQ